MYFCLLCWNFECRKKCRKLEFLTFLWILFSFDWLVAGLAAIPYLFWTDIGYINHPGTNEKMKDSAYCAMEISNIYPEGFPVYELSAIVFFVIPAGLLMFLYISMAITLHLSMRGVVASSGSVHGERQINSSRKQIIRMLGKKRIPLFSFWKVAFN